jgi:hypothetical protein
MTAWEATVVVLTTVAGLLFAAVILMALTLARISERLARLEERLRRDS